jgi:hypothetical protein
MIYKNYLSKSGRKRYLTSVRDTVDGTHKRVQFLLDRGSIAIDGSTYTYGDYQIWKLNFEDSYVKPWLMWRSRAYLSANDLNMEGVSGLSAENQRRLYNTNVDSTILTGKHEEKTVVLCGEAFEKILHHFIILNCRF